MRYDTRLALAMAEKLYDPADLSKTLLEVVQDLESSHENADDSLLRMMQFSLSHWRWCGYPRLVLSHKHAASLMCTNMGSDVLPDLRPPWPAFAVDVPLGLVKDQDGYNVASMIATIDATGAWAVAMADHPDAKLDFISGDGGLTSLLVEERESHNKYPHRPLLARLVVGAALEATQLRISTNPSKAAPIKRDRRTGFPETITFQIRRDIKVDCRQYVSDVCSGRASSAPTVQSLVKGHTKRQAFGKGNAQRKFIFVEPYWRGPEDAPIALRSHVLVDPRETT